MISDFETNMTEVCGNTGVEVRLTSTVDSKQFVVYLDGPMCRKSDVMKALKAKYNITTPMTMVCGGVEICATDTLPAGNIIEAIITPVLSAGHSAAQSQIPLDQINRDMANGHISSELPINFQHHLRQHPHISENLQNFYVDYPRNQSGGISSYDRLQLKVREKVIDQMQAAIKERENVDNFMQSQTNDITTTEREVYESIIKRRDVVMPDNSFDIIQRVMRNEATEDDHEVMEKFMAEAILDQDKRKINQAKAQLNDDRNRHMQRMKTLTGKIQAQKRKTQERKDEKWRKTHPGYTFCGLKSGFMLNLKKQ